MGRPSRFTNAQAERICGLIASGESLVAICKMDGMPDVTTVFRWLRQFESFRQIYAHAREAQAEVFEAQIKEIADTPLLGTIETTKEWGTEVKTADMIEHRRLQIDARKWIASKLKPKVYGARAPEPAAPPTTPDAPPPEDYTLHPDESGPDAPIL